MKKHLLLITILLLCTSDFSFGQSSYLKLIEKGKYSKAEKKINKAILKEPNDIGHNFTLAILLINRNFKGYNAPKSYEYIIESEKLYFNTYDFKEIKRLNKIPIDKIIIQNYTDTICKYALDDAIKKNSVEVYENYLEFYKNTPNNYKISAIEKRDIAAFIIASAENSVESYQYFISTYPSAIQISEATSKRNERAYTIAKTADNIADYKSFISKYPSATEVKQAWTRIHELAFMVAEKENTSKAYKKFIDEYPQSKQYKNAFNSFEEKQFFENTTTGDWESYKLFIENYSSNSWIKVAIDSIYSIGKLTKAIDVLSYCIENLSGTQRNEALLLFHDIFTNDGETATLNLFYEKYDDNILESIKIADYELAELGNQLLLNFPYNTNNYMAYDNYIRSAAPREKAFVALQRMISTEINQKKWQLAINKLNEYKIFFAKEDEKVINLIEILEKKWDNSIKILPFGPEVNTKNGNEYMPVISGDDKRLYFCGLNRKDNIGGEDIFVSEKKNNNWNSAKIVSDISSVNSNDAPLSISIDGNTLLLFKSGKIYCSEKNNTGWDDAVELPNAINSGVWQADAMLTSDGKGLIYSSTRDGGQNLYEDIVKYHGDNLYPSDIYISLLDNQNNYGEPINLGPVINTAYCDRMPFLHPDMKTLYFSSDGHGGLGKMDVFKSNRLNDNCWDCWSEPINLGIEINTIESDAGYKISTSGDKAYFSYEKKSYVESSIVFLLDVSGSMSGAKLEALKQATISVCQSAIDNNSEVSILTFANDCNNPIVNVYPFTKDISNLNQFVGNLVTSGGTPMYEAYYYASEYMKINSSINSKNKVITLMTDGDANGCTTLDVVLKAIKNNKSQYKTQTIAFDVNENSLAYRDLQKISSVSKGKFYSAAGTDDLGSKFESANDDIFNLSSTGNNKDVYWLNLPSHLRPDFVATVSGKLLDKNNNPVAAEIRWEDLQTGKNVGQSKSDPADGSFFIVLPLGKIYGYYIDKNEYFPISNNIDLRTNNKPIQLESDINIVTFKQMIEEGTSVPINNLFFDFAKYDLLSYSIPELQRIATIIKTNNLKVEIDGHTDNIGDEKTNQILSEKRANSVKEFLVKEGCDVSLLTIVGFGKTKPVASNENEAGRAKNRRVEFKFIK